ncbi:chaperonin 10-like protein, partial [Mycena sanguinolenta]
IEFTVFKGSPNDGIVESKTRHDQSRGNKVLVKISHSGVCSTDERYKNADMVLGHEGVGVVQQIGDQVTQFKVGDVVGWGYTHKTCGVCEQCLLGMLSSLRVKTNTARIENITGHTRVWDASFLFKIPDGLAPEHAAPLMCGGATVFEVIESYNIRPTQRVGVVGVGGLGHLAIQFLAKIGANVVVFSSTDSKREEAKCLGTTEFYVTKGVERFDMAPLDHLMVTTSFLPDWKPFLSVMKPKGTIYAITVSSGDLVVPFLPIVMAGINVQGSARLREGKMRYRGVLVAA